MKNNSILTETTTKRNNQLEKATIYFAVQNCVMKALNSDNPSLEEIGSAIASNTIIPSPAFKNECYLYSKKAVKKSYANESLCNALGCDYEDLIMMVTLRLIERFPYFVNTYYNLHQDPKLDTESAVIGAFSYLVSLIAKGKLSDLRKGVSKHITNPNEDQYNYEFRMQTVSLNKDYSADDENLCLADSLVSSDPTMAERLVSRQQITDLLEPLFEKPRDLMCFCGKYCGYSSETMAELIRNNSVSSLFGAIAMDFARIFDYPDIIEYAALYTESDLSINSSNLKRFIDVSKCSSKKIIQKRLPKPIK